MALSFFPRMYVKKRAPFKMFEKIRLGENDKLQISLVVH